MEFDDIVNATNKSLLRGGDIDVAIKSVQVLNCSINSLILGGSKTGSAKITKPYNLKETFIILRIKSGVMEQMESQNFWFHVTLSALKLLFNIK